MLSALRFVILPIKTAMPKQSLDMSLTLKVKLHFTNSKLCWSSQKALSEETSTAAVDPQHLKVELTYLLLFYIKITMKFIIKSTV